jgi:hypothetical protein
LLRLSVAFRQYEYRPAFAVATNTKSLVYALPAVSHGDRNSGILDRT